MEFGTSNSIRNCPLDNIFNSNIDEKIQSQSILHHKWTRFHININATRNIIFTN
jgi:hypothetical protein